MTTISTTAGNGGSVTGGNWVSRFSVKGTGFLGVRSTTRSDQRGKRTRTLITRLFSLRRDWTSRLRDTCLPPLVISPLVEPVSYRSLQAVNLGPRNCVPGDLPPPPQPVLQSYLILNASRYRRLCVVTRATLGSRRSQSLQKGDREVLNSRVHCHLVVQFQIERN